MTLKSYTEQCLARQDLTAEEAAEALDIIMTGQATDVQVAGLLVALRAKGESVDELVGFARTMRHHSVHITVRDPAAVDVCGTGGDGRGTFNISTVAAFVIAGAGATVAKHGNRSVSSRSGSADVLSALGVNIQLTPPRVEACIEETGIGFLFAPLFHPAMKYAAKPRVELGMRTIFNLLGPMTNPAGVKRQLVGTYAMKVAEDLANAFRLLGSDHVCVVHSDDGMDEISLAGPTRVFETRHSMVVEQRAITPETFGFRLQSGAAAGGAAAQNAEIALAILRGEDLPSRDVVLLNAGMGLYIAGLARSAEEGVSAAREALASGRALDKVKALVEFSQRA